jgi:6-phosphogluconolactonase (cycloisomerase 2 family)
MKGAIMNRTKLTGIVVVLSLAVVLLAGCGGSNSTATSGGTTTTPPPLSPSEFFYANNTLDNTVSQYQVSKDGTLTPLSPATVATGATPAFMVNDLKGHFLYVTNAAAGTISQYQINANGTLIPLTPSTVPAGGVQAGTNGTLGSGPSSLAVDSTNHFLYMVNVNDQNVRLYAINADGTLTFKNVLAGIQTTSFVTAHPQLPFLYAMSADTNTLFQFKIGSDGTLTPLAPATAQTPRNLDKLILTPNGKFAYLGFLDASIPAQYRVNSDGTLTALDLSKTDLSSGLPLPSVDPGSRFVYSVAPGPTGVQILQFKIQSDGRLAPLTPAAVQFGITEGTLLTFDPSGQFAYVPSSLADAIVEYRVGSDGTLADLGSPSIAAGKLPLVGDSVQRSAHKRSVAAGGSGMVFIRR